MTSTVAHRLDVCETLANADAARTNPLNAMLRNTIRVQDVMEIAQRENTYAAQADAARATGRRLVEAHPELPTITAIIWGGEKITLPALPWNTVDLAQAEAQHPDDVQYCGETRRITLTGEDGTPETWAEMQVRKAALSVDHTTPWLSFATVTGDISMDLDLAGVDQLITEYQAGLGQLLAARAALAEATR